MGENVRHLNAAEFDEFISSSKYVIVDFWAEWCGPCQMIAPVIEELADEYQGKITFAKVSTDENQELAAKFGIMSIPTLIMFRDGNEADRITGALSKDMLKSKIEKFIS